jgi:hypothetical protein
MLSYQFHITWIEHFSDNRNACFAPNGGELTESGLTQSLKRIRGRAWLEGSGTQHGCTLFHDSVGDALEGVTLLDRTRAGSTHDAVATNDDISNLDRCPFAGWCLACMSKVVMIFRLAGIGLCFSTHARISFRAARQA